MKTRFAPSPTGRLHLGNLRTALFNALLARREGGAFLLRIEDTDRARGDDAHADGLRVDLRWLGLAWQEECVQSQRGAIYAQLFATLQAQRSVYPCYCTKEELADQRRRQRAAKRPPRYPGSCLRRAPEEIEERQRRGIRPTLRFHTPGDREIAFDDLVRGPRRFSAAGLGDFIVRRDDGSPAFLFANAVDDALTGVTHLLRGEDHLSNTPLQILLLEALQLPAPRYGHLPLLLTAQGEAPLSKRRGDDSVAALRAAGYLPGAVLNHLARLGHAWPVDGGVDPYMEIDRLAERFALERLGRAPARHDPRQLLHWQREAVAQSDGESLWRWMGAAVHALVPTARRADFVAAVRPNLLFPADALRWARALYAEPHERDAEARAALSAAGGEFFAHALAAAERHGADFPALLNAVKTASGARGRALFQPLRAALTGALHGPELDKIADLLGPERLRERLQAACAL